MEQRRLRHPSPLREPAPTEDRPERAPATPPRRRWSWRRLFAWLGAGLASLVAILIVAAFFIDEPLRAYMERELNRTVTGYTFRIDKLDFHPQTLSLDLEGVTLIQNSQPDPPVARLDRWSASLEWKALLSGRLVSSHEFERPVLHITRTQAKKEVQDRVPVEKRGWQDAVLKVYPFKINELEIQDGELTYRDEASPSRPLRLRQVNVRAANIRNVRSKDREYPSEVHIEGVLFDAGTLRIDGNADFLAEPHVGIKGTVHLGTTPLEYLLPLTGRQNVQLRGGTIAADGSVEYGPRVKDIRLKNLRLENMRADYVHSRRTEAQETKTARQAADAAAKLNDKQELLLKIEHATVKDSDLGYVNEGTDPAFRVFLTQTNLELTNFSNQFREGPAELVLTGKFMGTGRSEIKGTFRAERPTPDFSLSVQIKEAQLKSLNNILRAYGDIDVAQGVFSFYAETSVKRGRVEGYFKPLFKDVEVYNEAQDREKGFFRQVYENIVGGLVTLLKNAPRDEVATKVHISGPVGTANTDTFEAVVGLVRNAFFQAILPGLDRELGRKR